MNQIRGKVVFSSTPGCHSINNCVYHDFKPLFLCEFVVFGIIYHNEVIYCYGGTNFYMFSKLESVKKTFISWILDVKVDDQVLISFMDGSILNLNTGKSFETNVKSIVSSKIISSRRIMFGCYDKIVFYNEREEMVHRGRVFYVCENEWGCVSAGEDRRIIIKEKHKSWEIQEDRNYVFKCGLERNYLFTINRDGTFKLYLNRLCIFKLETCFMGVSDAFIEENNVFIGLSNGDIMVYNWEGTRLSLQKEYDPCLSSSPLFIEDKSNILKRVISKHKVTIKNNSAFINKKQFYTHSAILKVVDTKKHINLLLKDHVIQIDRKDLIIKREIKIFKPSAVCGGVIGTKRGFILVKDNKIKVCDEEIIDLYRSKTRIYCLTEHKIYLVELKEEKSNRPCEVFFRSHNLNSNHFNNKFIYKSLEYGDKEDINISMEKNLTNLSIAQENTTSSNNLTNNSFREITTACSFGKFIVCGTSESKLVLFNKNLEILDCLKVDGQVSKIKSNNKLMVCGTRRGWLYIVKVIKNRFFVRSLRTQFKICDLNLEEKISVLDSGGYLRRFDFNEFREEENTFLRDELGCSLFIKGNTSYIGTSNGNLIKFDMNNNKKRVYKVTELSIFSIIEYKKHLYMVGDGHNIVKFNLKTKEIETKCIGSDPLVQLLISKNKITVLSRSGQLKTLSLSLEIEKEETVVCGLTNCMLGGDKLICFGDGCYPVVKK